MTNTQAVSTARPYRQIVRDSGQSLVELALILPLLLVILAGVADLGRSLQTYTVLLNATREAAMLGATGETNINTMRSIAVDELSRGGLDGGTATVTISRERRGFPEQEYITVRVNYSLPLLMSVLSIQQVAMQATTEMVVFEPSQ